MNDITKKFLIEIGISKGMTVLDVGCGRGVTTELLAELVGENGKVIGVDSNQNAINVAKSNANINNQKNIAYVCSDLSTLSLQENAFDAVVGRRILMYLSDPKAVIGKLATLLKPNGILGFQEHDSTSIINSKQMPLHHKVNGWLWELVAKNGGNVNIGQDIWGIFSHPSITIESIRPEMEIQTPKNEVSLASIAQTLMPLLLARGIVTESELMNGKLFEALESEKRASECLLIKEMIFFVSARKK